MLEEWTDIDGFEGRYKVSTNGDVFSYYIKRNLKYFKTLGYKRVTLQAKGVQYKFNIHRLVASAFIPNTENKPQVNHIDSDRGNNKVCNLEWVTAHENSLHRIKHGSILDSKGEKNPCSKLKDKDVIAIRSLYSTGRFSQEKIGNMFDVHPRYVNLILKGKRWKHI